MIPLRSVWNMPLQLVIVDSYTAVTVNETKRTDTNNSYVFLETECSHLINWLVNMECLAYLENLAFLCIFPEIFGQIQKTSNKKFRIKNQFQWHQSVYCFQISYHICNNSLVGLQNFSKNQSDLISGTRP